MNFLLKSARLLEYVLLLLGAAIFALVMIFDSATGRGEDGTFVGSLLLWAEALLAVAAVFAVVLPIVSLVQNPKGAGKSLYGIVAVAVIVVIAYLCASTAPITLASGKVVDDAMTLIFSDIAIFTIYICASIAILSIICTEIYRITR